MAAQLARTMMRVAAEVLLDRLPGLRLVQGQGFDCAQALLHLRSIEHLYVEW